MLNKLLAVIAIAFTLTLTLAHAENGEVYMVNQAGGVLVLTHDQCAIPSYKERFPYKGYGTEVQSNGQIIYHEGCYVVPNPPTPEEAKSIPPNVKIIPVVNFIDDSGQVHTLSADWFTSEKPDGLADSI